MYETYTDYINKVVLTIPDKFIDVKTGEAHIVSSKIRDEVEYHANNNTLIHLVFSALSSYLQPQTLHESTNEILVELLEIKKMIQSGSIPNKHFQTPLPVNNQQKSSAALEIKEVEEILESFGG